MNFGIYLPPQVLKGYPAPVLYFLSGLHGDGSKLIRQTGIQRFAAQWNIIVVFPDTSPRGSHISDSTDEFIGQGAGFYVDATKQPWTAHYQMYNHVSMNCPSGWNGISPPLKNAASRVSAWADTARFPLL